MKTKYGWIAAFVFVITVGLLWLWFDSDRESTVESLGHATLRAADKRVRQMEKSTQLAVKGLAEQMESVIHREYMDLLRHRTNVTNAARASLGELAKAGQQPIFVAVVGVRDSIVYLNVKGKEFANLMDGSLGAELPSLIAKVKTNSLPQGSAPEGDKVVPKVLLPGEKEGKYIPEYVPKKDTTLNLKGISVYRVPVCDIKTVASTHKKVLVKAGAVVVGYAAPLDEKGKVAVMNFARSRSLRASLVYHEQARVLLKDTMTDLLHEKVPGLRTALLGERPYIMMVLNPQGYVVARDTDLSKIMGFNYLKKYPKEMAAIALSLKTGRTLFDLWRYEIINRLEQRQHQDQGLGLYQAVVVPMRDDAGRVRGVAAVAWKFGTRMSLFVPTSLLKVAYFYNKHLYLTSFGQEEGAAEKALYSFLEGRLSDVGISPLAAGMKDLTTHRVTLGDSDYLLAYYKFGKNEFEAGDKYGYVVLVNLGAFAASSSLAGIVFLLILIIGLFVIAIVDYMVYAYMSEAIDEVEQGVQRLANGELYHVIEPTQGETVSLADSINELMDILLDRPMEDEETGERPPKEGIHRVVLGPMPGIAYKSTDSAVAKYVEMDDDLYSADLYQRFRDAWEQLGVEEVPERLEFEQRVALFERLVLRRFECDRVYFDVKVGQGEVILVPLPVLMV